MNKFDSTKSVLSQMKLMNIIKGDEVMEWYSPNREYKIVIDRYENQYTNMSNDGSTGNYIINLDFFNNLNIKLFTIKFSEIDAIRILDCLNEFLYEFDGGSGESYHIYLNPNNLRLENHILYLERLNIPIPEESENSIYRNILFQIRQYSPFRGGSLISILTLQLSWEELDQLAYDIFFSLIDLDIVNDVKYGFEI